MEYIYLHGFLSGPSSKKGEYLKNRFAELGKGLHCPDLNGGDFRNLTITSQMEIIDQLIRTLDTDITLLGSSLGGFLAVLSAEKWNNIRCLVLMAPAFDFVQRYFDRLTTKQLNEWQKTGFIKLYQYHYQKRLELGYGIVEDARRYDSVEFNRRIDSIIFHGLKDESVPYRVSIEYLERNPQAHLMLLNTDHSLLDRLDEIWGYMRGFLNI